MTLHTMIGLSTDRPCFCACGIHRHDNVDHEADAAETITITGGLTSPSATPMCTPCATWWRINRPDRVLIPHQHGRQHGGTR